MNTFGGRFVVVLVCLSLLFGGVAVTLSVTNVATGPVVTVDAAMDSNQDNETVRHQNPEDQRDDADEAAVRRWLENELSSQLQNSAIQLSEGEYETAKDLVGDDYQDRYAQYVEVAGDTDEGTVDGDSGTENENDSFEELATEQEQLADLLEEFNETETAYYDAVEANDNDRAHELARDLEELAAEIDARSDTIAVHFESIEDATGGDFNESQSVINETNSDVQQTRELITVEQFEETTLRIDDPVRETISFREPLETTGTLRTTAGEPIEAENVTLEIGSDRQTVQTDETGSFVLEYRPTTVPASTTDLQVKYVPDRGSGYLGSETNVTVSIDQTEPELTDLSAPSTISAYDEVHVTGALTVDDIPVDNVTVDILLDDDPIGQTTISDGALNGTADVPPSVPDGDRELTVRLAHADRAIANATASTPITVLETESELSISAEQFGDELNVSGTLTTDADNETEIGSASIDLTVDGTSLETVSTDENGTFETTVELPTDDTENATVELAASYDGDETSFAPATASTTVEIPTDDSLLSSPLLLGGGGALVIAVGLGGLLWYRRRGPADGPQSSDDRSGSSPRETPSDTPSDPSPVEPLLSQASDYHSNDRPEEAVRLGYAAVRRAFQSRIDGSRALTHWEFYDRYHGHHTDRLRSMTEVYERATYGDDGVSDTDAASVLEYAQQLCEIDEQPDRELPADD